MPHYTLHRTHTHRSTSGVLSFVAGEKTWVPPYMEQEVVGIGAMLADEGDQPDLLGAEVVESVRLNPDERVVMLQAAFDQLIATNESKDFAGSGVPSVKAVERIVGFSTDRVEVTKAWNDYKLSKAE